MIEMSGFVVSKAGIPVRLRVSREEYLGYLHRKFCTVLTRVNYNRRGFRTLLSSFTVVEKGCVDRLLIEISNTGER